MSDFGSLAKDVEAIDFIDFVKYWFLPGHKICIVGIPASGKGHRLHQVTSHEEVVEKMNDDLLRSMCFFEGGMNLYYTVNPVIKDLGKHKRGGNDNIAAVRGLYADIDVNKEGKSGVFSSEEEILDFLDEIDLFPSCIVQSGSGGLHCYWRIDGGLTKEEGSELQQMWWAYLNEKAGDREIDRLVDISRILRVPGSVRFPKEEEHDRPIGEVRILHFEEGFYTQQEVRETAIQSFNRYKEYRASRRAEHDVRGLQVDTEGMSWVELSLLSDFETIFSESVSWDEILVPQGWTFIKEDLEGRREWARPGSSSKSAVTDWEDSPHVMSLLSTSPDTQMDDLKEDGVALTKFRVALRLMYNDNDKDLFDDWKGLILHNG